MTIGGAPRAPGRISGRQWSIFRFFTSGVERTHGARCERAIYTCETPCGFYVKHRGSAALAVAGHGEDIGRSVQSLADHFRPKTTAISMEESG